MNILNYNIVSPNINRKDNYYDIKKNLFIFRANTIYNYYLECSRINEITEEEEYYILFGANKFDDNCRPCSIDNYGRYRIRLHGKLKQYVYNETLNRGNILINKINETNDYTVYNIV